MTQQYRITLKMADGFVNEEVGEDLPQLIADTNALAKEHNGGVVHDSIDKIGSIIYSGDDGDYATGWADVTPVI
ncbi:hypothetical protein PROPHIGD54-2_139 [Mycobacterium phage prophiGD54-2]|uniref:hypothetical protein n=1 Tax=Mycobacteroides abscessus TaxID=36809 RepID=UPI0019CF71CE|nr:hypothetical protein [Mycobacteroides abscessus]QSM04717.1 hypothetical protein PROPHIGD54-2_139 [Mycobacterium phage prophiGD54-2]QSN19597.1 hypothetical protein I3U41_16850 [Mycobacteroides abscessus subsp. abscessus]